VIKDKLYCKRDFYKGRNTTGGAHSASIFYSGKWYDIVDIKSWDDHPSVITLKCENTNHVKFIEDNIYFADIKEVRKMKLNKIENDKTSFR